MGRFTFAFTRLIALFFCLTGAAPGLAKTTVTDLRCEGLVNPLGIDAPQPRLSWILNSDERGQRQTAYQILVAGTAENLKAGQGDLWDSGRVNSDQSIHVSYAGRPLAANGQCFWKVRVWDRNGNESDWSLPAEWTMGMLQLADWHAKWIGLDGVNETNYLTNTFWIWFPGGEPAKAAPPGSNYFRRTFVLPETEIKRARILLTGDNEAKGFINGRDVGGRDNPRAVRDQDITYRLVPGTNVVALLGKNKGDKPKPAGVITWLKVEFQSGETLIIPTDGQWKASNRETNGWNEIGFDDSGWVTATNLGPAGMEPWGWIRTAEPRRQPARWLRKEFTVDKRVRRATVSFSGLGWSELYLNGGKVGDHVLSPAFAQYDRRVFYVTHDVTKQLQHGKNALGVVLGNGRYYADRSRVYSGTVDFGWPKLFLQLRVEYADGSVAEVVSDEFWKLTTNGPIVANNDYDGEEYDTRLELRGWSQPGFSDLSWQPAQLVEAPPGAVVAEMIEPQRVTQTIKPVSLIAPATGMYVYDLGQNLAGWCRLHLTGPAGTWVNLRFAENIKRDGTLVLANLRGALVTDTYRLTSKEEETWEPRFTWHGFRYVEMTGYPGEPTLETLEGCVVNDDLAPAGTFDCSNPRLNRIYRAMVWSVRGNYHSIPTDCPQRDERQGWLGDRSEESQGETYLFDNERLYAKWVQDMADAQRTNGSVPNVAPAYWPIYSDDVVWPSSIIIIPEMLRRQYADTQTFTRRYPSAKRWVDYMTGFVTNGLIGKDTYGDWCVPPEDPALIYTRDVKRETDKTLLATAYFYHDLRLMEHFAKLLGKTEDMQRFHDRAEKMKTAFNQKFLNPAKRDQYDNGTQTSSVLPLAFGLVPDDLRARVFQQLVDKIEKENHGHIGTGMVGGQYLMRVLSDNGRPDLVYTMATQTNYPGWGYMLEQGATTIWELWNGDTADSAMNSGNHVMLIGDFVTWLYENLAGIQSDPDQPGFKHILMRPQPVGDLKFVRATHRSPHGLIVSDWQHDGRTFDWQVEIPVNTTATVCVPARDIGQVLENGMFAKSATDVKFLRMENGYAVFNVGSGKYHFVSE